MSALSFEAAAIGYAGKAVVRDVDFEVAAGEFVGLVGPNGAGKTTMLKGVTGGAEVVAGRIEVCGRPAVDLSARELARLVGVLPQGVVGEAPFTAREFVSMGRHAHVGRFGSFGSHDQEMVEATMVRTDTRDLAERRVNELSGGELQRLALAQALAQEPEVLLLDEPTSHLDVNHRLQILDLCRGLAGEGMAVLGVFHDLDLAARYSDRIAVVADGHVVRDDVPEEVLRPDLLRDVFRVRAVVGTDAATGSVSVTPLLRMEDAPSRDRGRVLVVGGSGHGAWLISTLAARGFDVRLAATSTGDTDREVADVLGVPCVEMAPFAQMDDDSETAVGREASLASMVVVSETPFGRANVGNLRASVRSGTPVVLVGTMDAERDFCDGEAVRLWDEAVRHGAVVVRDREAAVGTIEGASP